MDNLEIEIFDAASHDLDEFTTKEEVQRIVDNFDPAVLEPPATIDHVFTGDAHGWAFALRRRGTKLLARFRQVSEELKTKIRMGRVKTRSVVLYRDFKGKGPALQSVGFLGAAIPECKGLAPIPSFSEAQGGGVVLFAEGMPPVKELSEEKDKMETIALSEHTQIVTRLQAEKTTELAEKDKAISEKDGQIVSLSEQVKTLEQEKADRVKVERETKAVARFEELKKAGKALETEKEFLLAELGQDDGEAADRVFKFFSDRPAVVDLSLHKMKEDGSSGEGETDPLQKELIACAEARVAKPKA